MGRGHPQLAKRQSIPDQISEPLALNYCSCLEVWPYFSRAGLSATELNPSKCLTVAGG